MQGFNIFYKKNLIFGKDFHNNCEKGHGSDVKCVDWHPHKAVIMSGSKDSQQPIILWDAKSCKKITTMFDIYISLCPKISI